MFDLYYKISVGLLGLADPYAALVLHAGARPDEVILRSHELFNSWLLYPQNITLNLNAIEAVLLNEHLLHLLALLIGHLLIPSLHIQDMLLSFGLQACDYLILEHFLFQQHDVGSFEDIQRDVLIIHMFRTEKSFLIAAEDVLPLLVDEAGPALEQVELAEDGLVLAVGQLCYVLQCD